MKLKPRQTARRILTKRIVSPTYDTQPGGKVRFLIGYVDEQAFERALPTSKELFALAAGDNEEGQLPDGMDRLTDHQFVLHVDSKDKVVGMDVIPARVYRGGVVPVNSANVQNVRLEWQLGGAVCRVTQKPHKVKASTLLEVIAAVDELVKAGKDITLSTTLKGLGRVQVVESEAIEIRLTSGGRSSGKQLYNLPIDAQESE